MARGNYKRKRERSRMRATMIEELNLPARIVNRLRGANIFTLADLVTYSEKELATLPGVGKVALEGIVEAVSIPVMAKCRIGHFVEAQVLQSLGVDFIDESEVLTPADDEYHVNKWDFDVPFVCGARNLGEALRRIAEGAAMIRTKGEPGTGNVVEAVRHMRTVTTDIARIKGLRDEQLFTAAKDLQAPYELVKWVAEHGCLPVVNFSAGGIATPADAALMMQLGCDGVFVGSGIFKSGNPAKRARAIVEATTNYDDPDTIARVSRDLGEAMVGIEISDIPENELMAGRGW